MCVRQQIYHSLKSALARGLIFYGNHHVARFNAKFEYKAWPDTLEDHFKRILSVKYGNYVSQSTLTIPIHFKCNFQYTRPVHTSISIFHKIIIRKSVLSHELFSRNNSY